ncbi:MAG: V-type ATP synthase subunit I [Candidatus Humimicrobiaceae bacterium]
MAVAKLSKLFIASHRTETEAFLKKLQRISVAEVKPYAEKIESSTLPIDASRENNTKVKKALNILDGYKGMELKKIASKAGKLIIKRSEYEKIVQDTKLEEIADEIMDLDVEIKSLDLRISETEPKINQLEIWDNFKGNIKDLGSTNVYTLKLGIIKSGRTDFGLILEEMDKNHISCQSISEEGNIKYVILAYHNDYREEAEDYISTLSFDEAELAGYSGTIDENIESLNKNIDYFKSRKQKIFDQIEGLTEKYEMSLTVYLDYLDNNLEVEEAILSGFSTDSVSFYTAWTRERDKEKVLAAADSFKFIRVEEIEPDEGESIPVALENKPFFRPFEIIVNLYGVPRYFEIDPTPFVSIFFAIFFGLCLTDAGYGIILGILTLVFAFRMRAAKQFLMLIFIGSMFTIIAGALFNGWFGDLPAYLGFGDISLKIAILGDPVNSDSGSMNFFRLALALGVVHVVFGLFIKFFDSLRRKDWGGAFFDGLPWIMVIVPIVILLLSTEFAVSMQLVSAPLFPSSISRILIWPIIVGALVIIFFAARQEKSWGFRIFMGFLNLTIVNGLTSFLGDFLSYIRLMALGLVTAGIGVAINKIAFQFLSIPVAGIALLVIVLVFGHLFNIGINILGAFVHTLRLQYVEFFPKFYAGGGIPFKALSDEHKYITIVD